MSDSFLSVSKSLNNARWVMPRVDEDAVARMVQLHNIPEYVARMLHLRGVAPDGVQGFLFPSLKDNFPDPGSMAGMKEMASFVADAVMAGTPIGLFADFDVDGATSAAILTRFFRHLGQDVPVYIPDRLCEGYGPSVEAFQALKNKGAEIVLVADCGVTSHAVIEGGRALGLDIIILDHHEPEETLPQATHVIDPKRADDHSGLDMMAACGVCFMTCVAINAALREKGFYTEIEREEPPLKNWLDLVALGTVCDMVPLTGVNRLFVRAGFTQMAQRNNTGIRALFEVANITALPEPDHAGFVLGPRINAGSRVHKSDLGAKLLSTDDDDEARAIAWALQECNEQRKSLQADMLKQAIIQVESKMLHEKPVIIVGDKDWHPGLTGLVAGKLKDRYGKPAICVSYAEGPSGVLEGRGSGRSIKGVNMAHAFMAAREADLLIKGGGHAMAGGFTMAPEKYDDLCAFLSTHIEEQMLGVSTAVEMTIDSIATVRGARVDAVRLLNEQVGPFGQGHAEPVFALANIRIHEVDILKEKHVRVLLSDWEGGGRMKAMLFYGVGTALGDTLVKQGRGAPFHIAGQFKINEWQGRQSVEFFILDAAPVHQAIEEAA